MERFNADIRSSETQRRIDADREAGQDIDIQGTPTLIINGRRFNANPSSLNAYIREELEQ
jgi:protein-disulfide isomerase